jgi:hypothetical protein
VPEQRVVSNADFDELSWHDALIRGIEFRVGDPAAGDFTADLVLQLDVVTAVSCGIDVPPSVEYTPATLAFHGVTDPSIRLEWMRSGYQVAVHPVSIHRIHRAQQPIEEQKVGRGRPYYLWRIEVNWPEGEMTFGADDFTQTFGPAGSGSG